MSQCRRQIAERYDEAFADLPVELPTVPAGVETAWHLYVLRVNAGIEGERDRVISSLSGLGIATSVHFIPLHLHSYYRETYGYAPEDFPVATLQFERSLSLPIYSAMATADVDRVIEGVRMTFTDVASTSGGGR